LKNLEKLTQPINRQAATIAANICVYTIKWLLLSERGNDSIKKEDSAIFTVNLYSNQVSIIYK
jgi:hypothetical protein